MLIPFVTASGTKFFLDNHSLVLSTADNTPLFDPLNPYVSDPSRFNSVKKSDKPETLRVSLGQACNYSCSYCSQRDLGDPTERPPRLASATFVDTLHRNLDLDGISRIELWGGETLLYWNDIVNIMDNLDRPGLTWYMPTNGTTLMMKHVDYLSSLKGNVALSISHDGLGHATLRGKEFLHRKVQVLKAIQDTGGKIQYSFNPVISARNHDLLAQNAFFRSFFAEHNLEQVSMNFELCRAYGDEGSADNVIQGSEIALYRHNLRDFLDAHLEQFKLHGSRRDQPLLMTNLFHSGFGSVPIARSFGRQKSLFVMTNCGVDDSRLISLDLEGNVRVCQNTDVRYTMGNLNDVGSIEMKGVKFRANAECSTCQVVQLCKGSCPIDTGDRNFNLNHEVEYVHYTEILMAALRLVFNQDVIQI